ncbi:hypothetical protein LCGC14_2404310, partial [marine sediment metagenome]
MPLRVLTFNLHSQYLYLLSFTGWSIDNLVIPPTNPPGWHSQPYGYPTFSPAVHPVPGFDYFFPGCPNFLEKSDLPLNYVPPFM